MRNHFHLVLETPEPNLTTGMHWLQSTVATRFNRFRGERGHLFQGRYQALPIEDGPSVGHVIDYVHLNPVRAGIVTVEQLGSFRWSSLTRFLRGPRGAGLDSRGVLGERGWSDTPEGWAGYLAHLTALASNQDEQKRLGYDGFSRGWAIGTQGWRRALAKQHQHLALTPGLAATEARALREERWRQVLNEKLKQVGRTQEEALRASKTIAWKLQLAQVVRAESGAAMVWLVKELGLGAEGTARSLLCKLRKIQQYSA